MDRKNMTKIEKIARANFDIVEVMGVMDTTNKYVLSIDGYLFDSADRFYTKYPQYHTPYHVQKVDDGWKIVHAESVDMQEYRDIDGGKVYPQRQGANRRCKQLNDEWHVKNDNAYMVEL